MTFLITNFSLVTISNGMLTAALAIADVTAFLASVGLICRSKSHILNGFGYRLQAFTLVSLDLRDPLRV